MIQRGFSLVELSIVLVILGLLTGGILAGQSLIRAAELRNVSTDYSRYAAAVKAFQDKYFAIPGDMSTATKFWGVLHATPATCATTAATGTATCDGNGNGVIPWNTDTNSNEKFRFWQHLANAGLIEGQYSGTGGGGTYDTYYHVAGLNTPRAKISAVTWGIFDVGTVASGNAFKYAGTWGNILEIGIASVHEPVQAFLKPQEAWNIDTKMDDGFPGSGKIMGTNIVACTTSADNTVMSGAYELDATSATCALMFPQFI